MRLRDRVDRAGIDAAGRARDHARDQLRGGRADGGALRREHSRTGSRRASTASTTIRETRTLIAAIVAARQVEELRREGFDEFHFYTLNQADVVGRRLPAARLERRRLESELAA